MIKSGGESETQSTGTAGAGRKPRKGVTRLSSLVPAQVAPVFARRGFGGADLTVHWPEIAGPGVAKNSRPIALTWPRGGPENGLGATLTLASTSGFALDLQQMSPVLIERINRRLGWRCVTRIVIKQMPVRQEAPPRRRSAPTPEEVIEADHMTAGIHHDGLKQAMTRLGAATLARARRRRKP